MEKYKICLWIGCAQKFCSNYWVQRCCVLRWWCEGVIALISFVVYSELHSYTDARRGRGRGQLQQVLINQHQSKYGRHFPAWISDTCCQTQVKSFKSLFINLVNILKLILKRSLLLFTSENFPCLRLSAVLQSNLIWVCDWATIPSSGYPEYHNIEQFDFNSQRTGLEYQFG